MAEQEEGGLGWVAPVGGAAMCAMMGKWIGEAMFGAQFDKSIGLTWGFILGGAVLGLIFGVQLVKRDES